jgi:hypothetical protein
MCRFHKHPSSLACPGIRQNARRRGLRTANGQKLCGLRKIVSRQAEVVKWRKPKFDWPIEE